MVDFSLILPTRERPSLVRRLFASLLETASDPGSLEVVLYVDEDDAESAAIAQPSLRLVKLTGPRRTMGAMTRACFAAAQGRFIVLINDDAVVRTKDWDLAVKEAFARRPDGIAMAYPDDLYYGAKSSTFPILTRKACEAMGELAPSEYQRHCIDSHIFDVFERLSRLGFERRAYLPGVVFEHLQHASSFEAGHEIGSALREDRERYRALAGERQKTAERLADRIRRGPRVPSVSVIAEREPGAANAAARAAEGDYLAFLDASAQPQPGWLQALAEAAEEEGAGVAGSKWLNPRSGRVEHAGVTFYRNQEGALSMSRIYRGFEPSHPAVNRRRRLQALERNGLLVKRGLFLSAGGFATDLPGLEGPDLCLKARRLVQAAVYVPDAAVYCVDDEPAPADPVLRRFFSRWGEDIEPDLPRLLGEDGFVLNREGGSYSIRPARADQPCQTTL